MKAADFLALAALLLLAGHAAARDAGKKSGPDVAQLVTERSGKQLCASDPADARRTVQALLKRPLTAERAAQIALLNNPSLQATIEDIGISRADLRDAGLLKNPSLAGSARFPDRPPTGANLEGELAQDFLELLLLPLRKRMAAAQFQQTKLRVADEVLKLIAETKSAFYEVQAQQQLAGRMKLILETNRAAVELAQKQHEAGNINDLELANQQASYSQARLELALADAEIRARREKLNRLMGAWGADTDWQVSGDLPPVPADDLPLRGLESLAVEQRLDLAAAHAELSSVVQALGLTKTYRFLGALEVGINSEREPDRTVVTGPTLRLELPIFNLGQARVARARAQLRQAERRFEALAVDIRSEVRELRDRLIAKRDVARFYHDELLPERIRIVNLTQLHYNAMFTGAFELLAAKQNELNAERGYVEAARDYWTARAELERAVGGGFSAKRRAAAQPADASKDAKPARAKTSR